MTIRTRLDQLAEPAYAEFSRKITPNLPKEKVLGIRVPVLRSLAKEIHGTLEAKTFLGTLPHEFQEENLLHSLLINEERDFSAAVALCDAFLPFVDNWAVCDILSPKPFKKHHGELLSEIKRWTFSKDLYTSRFGIKMLMSHYLDNDFCPEALAWPAMVRSEDYYLNMMIAWHFATALAKKWDETIPYLTENKLDVWTHNKTIRKAIESYRVTNEQKTYLRTLKRE